MPIKSCQINNKKGYKWGDQGKCYTYDPTSKASETRAWNRAKDQGIAIGEYFREVLNRLNILRYKFAKEVISFDFDGVVSTKKGLDLLLKYINDGYTVIILTARLDKDMEEVKQLAESLNIKYYNTNLEDKYKYIDKYNIIKHYDNSQEQVDKINQNTKAEGILFK